MVRPCQVCGATVRELTLGMCHNCHKRQRRMLRDTRVPEAPDLRAGACVGTDRPEAFYAYDSRDPHERQEGTAYALATCAGCPVIQACGEWGLRHELHGVWGGLHPLVRARLRRKMPDRERSTA